MAELPLVLISPWTAFYSQPAEYFRPVEHELQEFGWKKRSLLGKLFGKKSVLSIHDMIDKWDLDNSVIVKFLGDEFYLFSFPLESDFIKVWSHGTVFAEGLCLAVRRWCPGLELDSKSMSYTQMWMKLPDLDRCYWTNEVLSMMASSAGQPIAIDTSSSDEARVCIEVDVNEPLVTGVHVDDGEGGFWQSFRYEIPGLCFHCGRIGHKREYCPHPRRRNKQTYGSHNLAPRREHGLRPLRYFSWHRPDAGWVKLNFDGSFKGRTGRAGGGGLLRDAQGSFIAAFATPLDTSNSLIAEIGALEGGLRLALKLNVERILIEGDSKITIEMLNGKREATGEEEKSLMTHIHELLQGFQEVTARHEFREANRPADHLANIATQAHEPMEWHPHPPHSLLPFLHHDQFSRVVPRLVL
ncbi:hypothetical protein VitviT2T_004692 [Vitis vinifera]|uniref:CCHC-type domain-containing protein n=1 Tax=Vitis vinifera TaxID=29760 RepID=A0ABY9BQK0_VITVI|nr:hypothetical protein VitviT2T_004692 [Vitis vinifera]